MRRRQFLLGSSAVLASGTLLTGTTAFSSSELDRSVDIAVVADEHGYLGLSEGDSEETELLFDGKARTAAVKFRVTNQTSSPVNIDIYLDTLVFTGADGPADGSATVSVSKRTIKITDLPSGNSVTDITVDVPNYTRPQFPGVLSFDVTGEDGGIQITADRALTLEVPELTANVKLANINSPINIALPGSATVDGTTVTAIVDGVEFDTTSAGGSDNLKIDYDDSDKLGCDSSNDETTVTIEGSTTAGIPFSGTVNGVNCSADGD